VKAAATPQRSSLVPVTSRSFRRTLFAALLTWLPAACAGGLAGWERAPVPIPDSFALRQQVQVWRGDHSLIWHAVERQDSTLSGIPYHRPPDCDSCREKVPLETVDSLRLGSLERVGWLVAASPWILGALSLIYLRATWGD
jgi:hypothetical protein